MIMVSGFVRDWKIEGYFFFFLQCAWGFCVQCVACSAEFIHEIFEGLKN